ncbi:gp56 [Burkholderia phage BcepB1A]|uniref:gp56 n=1 Tax=Burkholderia phage BcepB1A TaxID=279530 RepID=UPI00003779A9|nr:gp56 [Burkholderia phage BcepB1A]AAT37750.1 gp56 [Burkholderia phage BcepB1A]
MKFRVKVCFSSGHPEVYEFDGRPEAFRFAESLFGDDVQLDGKYVSYVVLAPVR